MWPFKRKLKETDSLYHKRGMWTWKMSPDVTVVYHHDTGELYLVDAKVSK